MLTKIQHDGGAYRDTGNKTSPFHTATSPCDDFALSQCLFMSHIFPNVCLMKYHNRHGVYFPAVLCGLCCHPKTLGFKRRDTDSLKSFHKYTLRSGNNKDEKIQFFEEFKRCQEFSLSRADWKHILLERKDNFLTATISTHQRDICHGVHDNSLVLRSVFSDSPKSRFQHMVPIQEGLLCSRFYPHFILEEKELNPKDIKMLTVTPL